MISISNLFISNAYAEGAAASQPDTTFANIIFIGFIAVFIFFVIIPQFKRSKEMKSMLSSLQKGDEIVTTGGVMGRIAKVGDSYVSLEVAEGVNLNIQKGAIQTVLPKGTLKSVN